MLTYTEAPLSKDQPRIKKLAVSEIQKSDPNNCKAKTKSGGQCRNTAMKGSDYCYIRFHGPINKPLPSRLLNFISNHSVGFIIAVILMLIPLSIEFHHYALEARSGVIDSAVPASTANISIGAGRFHFDNPDGIFLREGDMPILEVKLQSYHNHWFLPLRQRLLVTAIIRDASGKV